MSIPKKLSFQSPYVKLTKCLAFSKNTSNLPEKSNWIYVLALACYVKKSPLKYSNFAYVDSKGNQLASIIETSQFLQKIKNIIQQCTAPDVKVFKKKSTNTKSI